MKMPKRSVKIALLGLVAVAVAVVVGTYLTRPSLPDSFAFGNGRTEATSVDVVTKISGRLSEVLAQEGDMVAKNQVVAKLDSKELDAQLRQAEAQEEQAKQQKVYAQAVVAQRESELNLAEKTLARSESLYVNKSVSLEQLQQDQTTVQTAKAVLAAAQADVVKAEAAIQAAAAQVETVRVNRDESVLVAPVDGRVLYRIAEPGEMLKAGGSIFTVLDLSDLYMNIFLPTEQVGRVAIGAEARIVLDAMPQFPLEAKVTFVEPQAQFTPKEVETRTEREKLMFKVKVTVNPDILKAHIDQVKTGLPGVAYVRLDSKNAWPENLKLKNVP